MRKFVEPPSLIQRIFWKRSSFLCQPTEQVALIGSRKSLEGTMLSTTAFKSIDEAVTWLSIIDDIHTLQGRASLDVVSYDRSRVAPLCLTRRTRSWDFVSNAYV